MIDSMHQSWLPRVVAAAFYSEDPTGSCALLQRTQPQAVTAARYPALREGQLLQVLLSFSASWLALSITGIGVAQGNLSSLHALPSLAPVSPRCLCRSYCSQPH